MKYDVPLVMGTLAVLMIATGLIMTFGGIEETGNLISFTNQEIPGVCSGADVLIYGAEFVPASQMLRIHIKNTGSIDIFPTVKLIYSSEEEEILGETISPGDVGIVSGTARVDLRMVSVKTDCMGAADSIGRENIKGLGF